MPRHLVQLRPRRDEDYIGHSHSILLCGPDGFIKPLTKQGLFVFQTRSLSRLRYLLNGKPFEPVSLSAVGHHSWLGYYVARVPSDKKSKLQDTIELRVSRFAGHGFHEELDLTNFSRGSARFQLAIEIGVDFADQKEADKKKREASGETTVEWRANTSELIFEFHAAHAYDSQGERGVARVRQALTVSIRHARSTPSYSGDRLCFSLDLLPKETWHACIDFIPRLGEKNSGAALRLRSLPEQACGDLGGRACLAGQCEFHG